MPLLFKHNDTGMLIRSVGKDGRYYTKDDVTQEVQIPTSISASVQK